MGMTNEDLNDPFHEECIALYKKFHDLCKAEQWSYEISHHDGDHSWDFVVTTFETVVKEFRVDGMLYHCSLEFILADMMKVVDARRTPE